MSPQEAIHACTDAVFHAAAALSFHELVPGRARALGGRLFRYGPLLVETVARALCEKADLFPDLAGEGERLAARQARAFAWQQLAGLLHRLAQRATASYLTEQAGAIEAAHRVVRQIETEAALPYRTGLPDREERLLALLEARRILQRHRDRVSAGRRAEAPARRPRRLGAPVAPVHPVLADHLTGASNHT